MTLAPAIRRDAPVPPRASHRPEALSVAEAMDAAFSGDLVRMVLADGRRTTVDAGAWSGRASDADVELFVAPCQGPTLDLGCGPGRLTGALARRGVAALGTDISAVAVRHTRGRGAHALRRDVYDELPFERRWRHVLLADGNIGIGGDPAALLRRVARLLQPGGTALVELSPRDATRAHAGVRLHAQGRTTTPFGWATLGASTVARVAHCAGLRLEGIRTVEGRPVATLTTP